MTKKKDETEETGTKLVYSYVAFHHGAKPGVVSELPVDVADQAIANGWAKEVSSLKARVGDKPVVPPASHVTPQGTDGVQKMSDRLATENTKLDGIDRTYTENTVEMAGSAARHVVDASGEHPV